MKRFRTSVVPTTEVFRLGQPNLETEISVPFFVLSFHHFLHEDHFFYNRLNLLGQVGCDPDRVLHGPGGDTDLDVVDDRRKCECTQCPGDDGTSSTVLESAGQVSTDTNTTSVVYTTTETHTEAVVGDVESFSMGEILDGMVEDFNNR